jgi:mono/diheme cytochrome c family protein
LRSLRVAAVALVAIAGSAGCTQIENTLAKVPFLAFLHSSPSIDPYEMPRPAPVGSVPVRDPFGVAPHATGNAQPQLLELAGRATNPMQPGDTAALANGRVMFQRHCMVCHGAEGQGSGPIVGPDRFPMGPSLVTPTVQGYSDGYVYAVVRMGRGLMPAYGPRMTEAERWQVVSYVRSLSGAAAQPAAPVNPDAGTGTATSGTGTTATGTTGGAGAPTPAPSGTATPQR